MEITINVSLTIYIIVEELWLLYALNGDKDSGMFGSQRDRRMFFFYLGSVIYSLVWGGFFWW